MPIAPSDLAPEVRGILGDRPTFFLAGDDAND